ncbi:MAG: thioesterase family protein [bacterium]
MPSAAVELTVPFHDVDAMRIVWHGHYLKYFESARDRLFAEHNVDMYGYGEESRIVYPVIRTSTRHSHPLRYGDAFLCTARLVEARTKLIIEYEITLKESGQVCTRGHTEQVALSVPDLELQLRVPDSLRQAFSLE